MSINSITDNEILVKCKEKCAVYYTKKIIPLCGPLSNTLPEKSPQVQAAVTFPGWALYTADSLLTWRIFFPLLRKAHSLLQLSLHRFHSRNQKDQLCVSDMSSFFRKHPLLPDLEHSVFTNQLLRGGSSWAQVVFSAISLLDRIWYLLWYFICLNRNQVSA